MTALAMQATVRFFEDWRVGSGAGVATGVDRAVLLEDGVPYVPAKSLTGVWRDAAETLARGLDHRNVGGAWHTRVDELFGTQPARRGAEAGSRPRRGRLSVRPARLPTALTRRLAGPRLTPLRAALCTVRAGVRINPNDGTALDDHLRFEQTARRGLALRAGLELDTAGLTSEESDRLIALLVASAAFVDRIGAGRRRGLGGASVGLELPGGDLPGDDELLDTLRSEPTLELERAPLPLPEPEHDDDRAEGAGGLLELALEITARSPVLLAPKVTGNIHRGSDFIPGAQLLGIVCSGIDAAAGAAIAGRAVRDGELVVTAATPMVAGAPGRAMPACMARFKDGRGFSEPDGVRNAFADSPAEPGRIPPRQLKGLRAGYLGPLAGGWLPARVEPERVTRVHGVIDDQAQRPTEDSGLYSYAALPAGERLAAAVHITGALAATLAGRESRVTEALSGPRRIGRSKKDDYGAVSIAARLESGADDGRLRQLARSERLSVWLLDHVVLTGPTGAPRPTVEGLLAELETQLGGDDGSEPRLKLEIAADSQRGSLAAIRAGRVESWNATWGLPRETLCTLAPGSCAILEVASGSITPEALQEAERSGIGGRTAEGLGQVRFADPLLDTPLQGLGPPPREDPTADDPPPLDAETRALGRCIEDNAWREQIARAALLLAGSDPDALLPGRPPSNNSQLGNLRAAAADPDGASAGLSAWLREGDEAVERRQLSRGWTAGQRERLLALAAPASNELWSALERALQYPDGFFFSADDEPLLVTKPSELRRAHHDRALLAAVDGLVRVLGEPGRHGEEEASPDGDRDG